MKEKIFLVADTETVGLAPQNLVFDFAYIIATKKKIIKERSFIIRDILVSPKTMLRSFNNPDWRRFFGGKIFSVYIPGLATGHMKLYSWHEVMTIFHDDLLTYNVDCFCAYNINFDLRALRKTGHHITDKHTDIFLDKPNLLDLWLMACMTLFPSKLYHSVAKTQGWITDKGNVQTKAQNAYAFLTGDLDFIAPHTALGDAYIETEILHRLLARKKKIPYNEIQHSPWVIAQRIRNRRKRK